MSKSRNSKYELDEKLRRRKARNCPELACLEMCGRAVLFVDASSRRFITSGVLVCEKLTLSGLFFAKVTVPSRGACGPSKRTGATMQATHANSQNWMRNASRGSDRCIQTRREEITLQAGWVEGTCEVNDGSISHGDAFQGSSVVSKLRSCNPALFRKSHKPGCELLVAREGFAGYPRGQNGVPAQMRR